LELQFDGDLELEVGGGCKFELPSYVTRLTEEEVSVARSSAEPNIIVIAAGADPRDDKITLLTATGKVMVFDARKYHIPSGPAIPQEGGKKIFLINVGGRWPGNSPGFLVESKWMLSKSTSALSGATLVTNTYQNEDKTQ
jgi:hypothetical protein